jgi:hypothetical protein
MHKKTCFKCKASKPIDEFYKHPMMADGHLGKCKTCTKKDTAKREKRLMKNAEWRESEIERHREKSRRYRAQGKSASQEAIRKAQAKWHAANQHKIKAHTKVRNALCDGKLIRKPCEVCGELRAQAHHDDYSKPLDVRWLCTKHHAEAHVEINRAKRLKAMCHV